MIRIIDQTMKLMTLIVKSEKEIKMKKYKQNIIITNFSITMYTSKTLYKSIQIKNDSLTIVFSVMVS